LTGHLRTSYCEAGWTGDCPARPPYKPSQLKLYTCSANAPPPPPPLPPVVSFCFAHALVLSLPLTAASTHPSQRLTPPPGMFDRSSRNWHAPSLEAAAISHASILPDLCDACAAASSLPLLPSCPLASHLPPHARVLPPISDGAAANLGAGCVDNACACLTVGTSIALRTVVNSRARSNP
jgi:hypothetical protein